MSKNIKKSAEALNSVQSFKMQIALTQAIKKQHSRSISDNVKRVIQAKLEKGEWIGKMPFGYKTYYSAGGKKSQELDSKEGTIATYMFETYANGMETIESLSSKFRLSKTVVSGILKNPFYYGQMFVKSQNKYYRHDYPILIEKELFDKCQKKIQNR